MGFYPAANGMPFRGPFDDLFTGGGQPLTDTVSDRIGRVTAKIKKFGRKIFPVFSRLKSQSDLQIEWTTIDELFTSVDVLVGDPPYYSLSESETEIIDKMVSGYRWVPIYEYTTGMSPTRVLVVSRADGRGSVLPVLIKLGHPFLIRAEKRGYELVKPCLYKAAPLLYEPTWAADQSIAAIGFKLSGGGLHECWPLFDILTKIDSINCSAEKKSLWIRPILEDTLLAIDGLLVRNQIETEFLMAASYDSIWPANFQIEQLKDIDESEINVTLDACSNFIPRCIASGNIIKLISWEVIATPRYEANRTIILINLPSNPEMMPRSFRLELVIPGINNDYELGQKINTVGRVISSQQDFFQAELESISVGTTISCTDDVCILGAGKSAIKFPNPVTIAKGILNRRYAGKFCIIHSDLNSRNVLINKWGKVENIIDFARVHLNHVIHEFVRLETTLAMEFLASKINSESKYNLLEHFYRTLDDILCHGVNNRHTVPDELLWIFDVIVLIRQHAKNYLVKVENFIEYYNSLLIYYIGVLKFDHLKPATKRAFFVAGGIIAQLLTEEKAVSTTLTKSLYKNLTPRRLNLAQNVC